MTRTDPAEPGGRSRIPAALAIVALGLLLFGPSLVSRGPWHVDELRYAEVSRQMGEYGSLTVPEINGGVYTEKPPVHFWLAILFQKLVGDWLVASRLVAAISMIVAAWLLVPLGGLLLRSRTAGWLSALVFLTTAMAISRGEQGFIDSTLVSFTTGATAALLLSAVAGSSRRRWSLAALGALLLAGGMLTKGPVGLLCPLIGVLAAGLVSRGRKGVAILPLAAAVVVAASVSLLWILYAGTKVGWWYADQMLFAQTADRTVESRAHARPPTYYLVSVLKRLLPWALLLPGAVWLAWRRRRMPTGRGALAALAWGVSGIVVFSLFSAKRSGYVLPFYPAFALVIGWAVWRYDPVDRFFRKPVADRGPLWILAWLPVPAGAALALLPALAPLGPKVLTGRNASLAAALRDSVDLPVALTAAVAGIAVILVSVVGIRALREERVRKSATAVAFAIGILLAGFHATVVPALDPGRSPRAFGEALARNESAEEPYVLLGGHLDGRVHFYTRSRWYETALPEELDRVADRPDRIRVVADARQWKLVPPEVKAGFVRMLDSRIDDRDWDVWRELDLPRVPVLGASPEDLPGEVLVVDVLAGGRIELGGREVDLDELRERLLERAEETRDEEHPLRSSDLSLVLRVERSVPWMATMLVAQAAADPEVRIWKLFFGVKPQDGGPEGTFAIFLPRDPGLSDGPRFQGRAVELLAFPEKGGTPEDLHATFVHEESRPVIFAADPQIATGFIVRCLAALVASGHGEIALGGAAPPPGGLPTGGFPAGQERARILLNRGAMEFKPSTAPIPADRGDGVVGVTNPPIGEIYFLGPGGSITSELFDPALPPEYRDDLDALAALAGKDGRWQEDLRATGLSALAFLTLNQTHRHGSWPRIVKNGLRVLRQQQGPDGAFHVDPAAVADPLALGVCGGALVEAYRKTRSPLFKQSAQQAVDRLVTWPMEGVAGEARDLALVRAADAELRVPEETRAASRQRLGAKPDGLGAGEGEAERIALRILREIDPDGWGRLGR